jgi:hypothetical protein
MQIGNQNGISRGPLQMAAHTVKSAGARGLYHGVGNSIVLYFAVNTYLL